MSLEDEIVARLDTLVEEVQGLRAAVAALQNAAVPSQEPAGGTAAPDALCEWPSCGVVISGQQARLSREWCGHELCDLHEAGLRVTRQRKAAEAKRSRPPTPVETE